MLRYSAESKLSRKDVIDLASKHFGASGAGLKVTSRDDASICLESADGYVTLSTCKSEAKGRKTHLEIETREYDGQVTSFLRSL